MILPLPPPLPHPRDVPLRPGWRYHVVGLALIVGFILAHISLVLILTQSP